MATNYVPPPQKVGGVTYTTPQVDDDPELWVISYHLDQCRGMARFQTPDEAVEHCRALPIGWKHVIVEGHFVGQWSYWGEGFPKVADGEFVTEE